MTENGFQKSTNWDTSLPLGPSSLIWKHFGDVRSLMLLGRAGTLQNMHPVLDAALQQHSNFFVDPMDRFDRSIRPILSMIYQPASEGYAVTVRDFHKPLKGTRPDGQRYHALDPDVYWWTHVTFVESVIATQEFLGTPFTRAEREQIVAEGLTWWRMYGMSDRPAFGDYDSYLRYWDHMFAHELGDNSTTQWAAKIYAKKVPPPPGIPNFVWRMVRFPVMWIGVWVTRGTMPRQARDILGYRWSNRDQLAFNFFRAIVRAVWRVLPQRRRYIGVAWEGALRQRREPQLYLSVN